VFLELRSDTLPALDSVCPHCQRLDRWDEPDTGQPTAQWSQFREAIDTWWQGGAGEATCVHCQRVVALNDWQWEDGPWAFAMLGFTFWNWPPLLPAFVAEVGHHLTHRVRFTSGKI